MSASPSVCIIPTGVANLASIRAAFSRLDASIKVACGPSDISSASHAVLPGVGAFAAGMQALKSGGFLTALRERVEKGLPLLAVCLGMQLLCTESEESPSVSGVGVIPVSVKRLRCSLPIPELGWNEVLPPPNSSWIEQGYAYFAHSYSLPASVPGWESATCIYGEPFSAALRRGNVLACQFHPELSGPWGLSLLRAWLNGFK